MKRTKNEKENNNNTNNVWQGKSDVETQLNWKRSIYLDVSQELKKRMAYGVCRMTI